MKKYEGSFRSLIVWKESKALALEIYRITKEFPKEEKFGMVSQLRRASSSVMANIAEGNYRNTIKDRIHFFMIARGSLAETDCFLDLAFDLLYLKAADYERILEKLNKTGHLLQRLILALSQRV